MSKYEPRADSIRKTIGLESCKLSWTNRRGKIYLTIKAKGGISLSSTKIINTVRMWYPDSHLTSFGPYSATFLVVDIWKNLKNK